MNPIVKVITVDMRKAWNEPANPKSYNAELSIDADGIIFSLAGRAARSKNLTSKFMRGRVTLKLRPVTP